MIKNYVLTFMLILGLAFTVFGQTTVTIGTATTTTTYNPVYSYYGYNYTQQIYTAAEITAGGVSAGDQITAIRFYWAGSGNLNNTGTWTVFLGNTAQTIFTGTTNWIPLASLTTVYNGAVVLPSSAGWMTITLTTPYIWTGGNLVVAIDENVAGYGTSATWRCTSTSSNYQSIYFYSDGTNPDPASPPSGTITYNRPNIQLDFVSLIPCAGMPDPGTATISATTGCVGASFTLGDSGVSVGSGISYQWQSSSSSSGPWTDVPGGTTVNFSTSVTADTYFQLYVNCTNSGESATSNVVSYSVTGNACECGTYPAVFASSTADEEITNVTVGTMSNSSTCSTLAPGTGSVLTRYSNYTGFVAGPTVQLGELVNFSLTQTSCGGAYNNGFQLYVDWNQDGDFADAGEQVYTQPAAASGNHTETGSFTVPVTATQGVTRMRAVVVETTFPTATNYSSSAYTWGETEDYCITIIASTPCSGTPVAGSASPAVQQVSIGTTANLSLTGFSVASGMTYQWQQSASFGGPYTNVTGGTGATTPNYTTAALSAVTYFRCVVTCTASGESATSSAAEVDVVATVNMQTGTINTCGSIFYDSGGATGNYAANENYTLTVYPSTPGSVVQVSFTSFVTENSYEHLYIYDGNSTSATLLGNYTGSASIPTFTSTAADGSLTFRFTSDGSVQYAGWVANLTCYNPCVYFTPDFTQAGPYCAGVTIPELPVTSNDGVTGVWSPAINNMATTTYTFTPDPGQCALNATMTITINPNTPAVFDPVPSYCPGVAIPDLPLISNDGITGTWSPAIDNTIPTTYTFTADGGVCAWTTLTIDIDTFPHGITNNSGTTELTCSMTFISLTATGGVSYSWTGGPATVIASTAVSTPGTYTVTVNGSNGCSGTESIIITQDIAPPSVSVTNNTGTDQFICTVPSISLTATGGVSYSWNGGASPATADNDFTTPAVYIVTVTGANDCTATASVNLTQAAPLTIVETLTDALCFGYTGSADINVTAGGNSPYTILWEDGNTDFSRSGIPSDVSFGYTITDADLCPTTGNVFVNAPDLLTVGCSVTNASCFGVPDGSISASPDGGTGDYNYLWSNAQPDYVISNLAPGNYSLTVKDGNNCIANTSVVVNQPPEIVINLTHTDAVCGETGGTISADVTGGIPGYSYNWSSTGYGGSMTALAPGIYTLTVTDSNSCTAEESTTVGKTGVINANINIVSPVSCAGIPDGVLEGRSLNGVSPLQFSWSNGAGASEISNLDAGTFLLTVTDNWGCEGIADATLALPDAILLDYAVTNSSCYGISDGKINIGLSGGAPPFNISWSVPGSGTSINSLSSGHYSVVVTDSRNCSISQDFDVTQPERINLEFTRTNVSCYGMSDGGVSMQATGGSEPYHYSVSDGAVLANGQEINSLPKGNYTLIVRDNNNCYSSTSVYIDEPSQLDASVLVSNPSCVGNNDGYIQVVASGGTEPYKYFYDGLEMPVSLFGGLKDGTYEIGVSDNFDCSYTIGKVVLNESFLDCVIIPDAISPNGDGINDVWEIRNIKNYPGANIQVFNRWGQSVFVAKSDDDPWDAKQNGNRVAIGTYIYFINLNNGTDPYTGTVSIVY